MSEEGGCKSLYVGNLDPRVTDYMLTEIFATCGVVLGVKIIPDKNFAHGGLNYGFVEFQDHRSAEMALQTLTGRRVFNFEIKVNWAFAGSGSHKEDTSAHYHIFVGDLSPEVNDQILGKAFSAFGSMSDARVMWDVNSGKSRGYGFVAFRDKTDAEQAISTMNGEWIGSRAIRVNWANQKGAAAQPTSQHHIMSSNSSQPISYEAVVAQTAQYNTTVYVGNLTPHTAQEDLLPLFQQFGFVVEIRLQVDRGFAFVKMDTHENSALAIVSLHGTVIHGRSIKCSWGKDRAPDSSALPYPPVMYHQPMVAPGSYYPPPSSTHAHPHAQGYSQGVDPTVAAAGGQPVSEASTSAAQQPTWDASQYYGGYDYQQYAQYYGSGVPGH